jgi:hypothetical protein
VAINSPAPSVINAIVSDALASACRDWSRWPAQISVRVGGTARSNSSDSTRTFSATLRQVCA